MNNTKIKSVHARQIMDAKFRPVTEADVILECGVMGRGAAPTGTSVGSREAFVLRDNDMGKFCGLSVFKAVENINNIIGPALIGMDVTEQEAIDRLMIDLDGTPQKSRLGGNAVYSVSIACMQAAARAANMSFYQYLAGKPLKTLPLPTSNSITGGKYPGRTVCFQEFTFCPYKASCITEAMEIITLVHEEIGRVITRRQHGRSAQRGNAWGWAPHSEDPEEIMDTISEAVKICGYTDKVAYVLDIAANSMYNPRTDTYYMNGKQVTADEQISYVKKLTENYNFLFIEDVLNENDWDGYVRASKQINRTILIGDDLTVTNKENLKRAYETGAVDGFIFKPNQVGTITEALEARRFASEHNMITVSSQRGGGTVWDIVVDMGVGLEIEASKSCAPRGGESICAMNSIYRAEDENPQAKMFDFTPLVRF